jgi:hypothetical protein
MQPLATITLKQPFSINPQNLAFNMPYALHIQVGQNN